MNEETQGAGEGLFSSLKGLAASLVAIAQTRIELLSNDLEEERERLVYTLVTMLIGLFSLGIGVLLLTLLLVAIFWETHRLLVLCVLTGIFLIGGAVIFEFARYKLRTKPRLFSASLGELSKDHQQLTQRE